MNNSASSKQHSWNQTIEANAILILEKCVPVSIEEDAILDDISFGLDGITILVVASCGILLNLQVIFLMLTRRNLKNLFSVMFFSLLCFDTFLLILEIITCLHAHLGFFQTSPPFLFPNLIFPFSRFNLTAAMLIHIAISIERYLGTLYPLRHRSRISWKRLFKIFAPVITISLICTIPAFFETTVTKETSLDGGYMTVPTSFRHHMYYTIFYLGIVRAFVLGILPFIILIVLNWKILRATIHSRNQLERIRHPPNTNARTSHTSATDSRISEQNYMMTKTLIGTVLSFIMCHLPRVIFIFYLLYLSPKISECAETQFGPINPLPFWAHILKYASNVLVVINSSINSIIYCQFNKKIKSAVLRLARRGICCSRCNMPVTRDPNEQHEMQEAMLQVTSNHMVTTRRYNSLKCRRVHLPSGKRSNSV